MLVTRKGFLLLQVNMEFFQWGLRALQTSSLQGVGVKTIQVGEALE